MVKGKKTFWQSGLLGDVCISQMQQSCQKTKAKDFLEIISIRMSINRVSQVLK